MPEYEYPTQAGSYGPKLVIAAASLACYYVYRRYEPTNPVINAILLIVLPSMLIEFVGAWPSIFSKACAIFAYWCLVLASTVAYRLSPWHPLARFPGPTAMKISKIMAAHWGFQGHSHDIMRHVHQKYGDVVRIGPNELSFNREDAIQPIYISKRCIKGPYYDTRLNTDCPQIDSLRDYNEHARRRRPWARAMNVSAIQGYEEIVIQKSNELREQLSSRLGEVVDINAWFAYYGYDFMGHMVFGRDFGMLKAGTDIDGMLHLMDSVVLFVNSVSHIPWTLPFLRLIPGSDKEYQIFKSTCKRLSDERVAEGTKTKDMWYYLTGEDSDQAKLTIQEVTVDTMVAVVAGSDTASIAMTLLIYLLMRNPNSFRRLRQEIDIAFPGLQDITDMGKLVEMPYLNACINETLRLWPPVLIGLQRRVDVGTGEAMIGPYVVPEGTQVSVHHASLMREPSQFSPLPEVFWPDRWLQQDTYALPSGEVISKDRVFTNRSSFMPFGAGPQNCIGKNLALLELRVVICTLVQRFDLNPAEGYALDKWEQNLKERFLITRDPLPIQMTARK